MGATLVTQAIQRWAPHVSDRAFRVLIAMAVIALDKPKKDTPEKLYFGGQEALTHSLRRERGGNLDSAVKTVKRAIRELMDVGAIRCTQVAVLGSNAVYLLTLENSPRVQEHDDSGSKYFANGRDTPSPPGGDTPSPHGRDTPSPNRGTSDVPTSKETPEEPLEELEKEEGVSVRTDLAVTRNEGIDEPPNLSSSACRDPTCFMGFVLDESKDKNRNIPCPDCNPSNVVQLRGRRTA
jgi:hypothetical protein